MTVGPPVHTRCHPYRSCFQRDDDASPDSSSRNFRCQISKTLSSGDYIAAWNNRDSTSRNQDELDRRLPACTLFFQWFTDLREIRLLTRDGDLACHAFRYIVGLRGSSLRHSSLRLASAIQRSATGRHRLGASRFDEGICPEQTPSWSCRKVNLDQRTQA
jgi:hypothetical protein